MVPVDSVEEEQEEEEEDEALMDEIYGSGDMEKTDGMLDEETVE